MTLVFSVPASYKAIRKVPGGAAPVLAGAEASAVRLCQEVSIAPCPTCPQEGMPQARLGLCCAKGPVLWIEAGWGWGSEPC